MAETRECRCGGEHSPEWWDGYESGRQDGFEEAADWGGTWCEGCNDHH